MSLRIAQFNTTCHVPERHRAMAEMVDQIARSRFARDLGDHLGPSLCRQSEIVRIRRLALRVIVPASDFTEDFSPGVIKMIGALEVLAAVGLILPAALDIVPVFVALAATGLVLLMIGAMVTHARRKEYQNIGVNVILLKRLLSAPYW